MITIIGEVWCCKYAFTTHHRCCRKTQDAHTLFTCKCQAALGTLNRACDQISDASIAHSISLLCSFNIERDHRIADWYIPDITICVGGSKGSPVGGSPERKSINIFKCAAEDCLLPQEDCCILRVLCEHICM